jgi:hypothetical protein
MVAAAGAGTGGVDTTLGIATGFSEVWSQGTANAWAGLGSIGNPSGNGWLWDVTTLEQQQFAVGNWTPTLRFQIHNGNANATADLWMRAYRYDAATGFYLAIASCQFANQSIVNGVSNTYAFSATSGAAMVFRAGHKLYCDVWLNVTANSNGLAGATIRINVASSASQGNNTMQMVTPGYSAAPAQILVGGGFARKGARDGRGR